MVPAPSCKVSRVSQYSGFCPACSCFAYGAFTLFGWSSQFHSATVAGSVVQSVPRSARTAVWALPISLAATLGIDFSFFSSGYLDVSVRRVPLHHLFASAYSVLDTWSPSMWVPPFRYLRISVYLPLPAAFRSLSRLSSALSAKASALCPFLLNLSCCFSCLFWLLPFLAVAFLAFAFLAFPAFLILRI